MPILLSVPEAEELILPSRFNMPELLIPNRKPMQPFKIDWDHWAAKGLIRAYFFVGGDMRDYVFHEDPTTNTTQFSVRGLEQTDTEVTIWEAQHDAPFSISQGTLIHDFQSNGAVLGSNTNRFAQIQENGIEWRRQNSDTSLRMILNSTNHTFNGVPDMWDLKHHTIACTWSVAEGAVFAIVDDYVQEQNSSFTAIPITADLFLMNRTAGGDRPGEGRMTYFLAYNRALSIIEVQKIQKNPYQFLKSGTEVHVYDIPTFETFSIPKEVSRIPGRKPVGRVSIDKLHQLSKGLVRCWVFPEIDDLTKRGFLFRDDNTTPFVYPEGMAIKMIDSRMEDIRGNTGISGFSNQSIFTITSNDDGDASNHIFSIGTADNNQRWTIRSSSTSIRLEMESAGADATTVADLQDANFHSIGAVREGGNTLSDCRWMVDGELGVWSGAGALNLINEDITLGGREVGGVINESRSYQCMYIWNRALSEVELLSLYRDPYQFLKPAKPFQIPYEPVTALDGELEGKDLILPGRFNMPELLIPNRKPIASVRINTEHYIGKGIQACWLFQTANSTIKDLSGKQSDGLVGGASWNIVNGNRVLTTSDTNYATIPNFDPPLIGSLIVKFKTGDASGRQRLFGFHDQWELLIEADDTFESNIFNDDTDTLGGIAITENALHTGIVVWNSTTNHQAMWLDGVLSAENNLATNADPGSGTLTIGNRTGSSDADAFAGDFEFLIIKDYEINDAEAKQWSYDPYQFLKPATEVKYMPDPELDLLSIPNQIVPTQKPIGPVEIDFDHPLAKGLIRAFFFVGGDLRDVISTNLPGTNTSAFSVNGIQQTGTEQIRWTQDHLETDKPTGSLVFDFISSGVAEHVGARLIQQGNDDLELRRQNATNFIFTLGVDEVTFTVPAPWDETLHHIACIWDANVNFRSVIFDDVIGESSNAFSAPSSTANLSLLNRVGGDRPSEGRMTYFLWYDRVLSPAEIFDIQSNPYQILILNTPTQIPYEPDVVTDGFHLPDPRFEMPALMLPGRGPTGPVIIDRTHKIGKDLSCLWLPTTDGKFLRDLGDEQLDIRARERGVGDIGVNELISIEHIQGMTIRGTGATDGRVWLRDMGGNNCWTRGKTDGFCAFALVRVNDVDSQGDARVFTQDEGTAEADHRFMIGWTSLGEARARIKMVGEPTATSLLNVGYTIVDGDLILLVGGFEVSTVSAVGIRVFKLDGIQGFDEFNVDGTVLDDDPTMNIAIGATAQAEGNALDANVFMVGTCSRYLSNEECMELMRDPYQFLIPE